MPTVFNAQNGKEIVQKTPIGVEGCPYALTVLSRSVHKQTLTLKVSVPAAGKLTATGVGVSKAARSASARQALTLKLKQRQAGRLRTAITLRFTPNSGEQRKILHKTLHVNFP